MAKSPPRSLVILTATTNLTKALPAIRSWKRHAKDPATTCVILENHPGEDPGTTAFYQELMEEETSFPCVLSWRPEYMGTVPAFTDGIRGYQRDPSLIIACLHDDLLIEEDGWDQKILTHFDKHPLCGLLGFGGAIGLADQDIYQKPYAPQQLARIGFRSDLSDAEVHGIRSRLPERVACLDGFSLVGRSSFWQGHQPTKKDPKAVPLWQQMQQQGIVHHAYDSILGGLAKRNGWEVWYLPVRCTHKGGQTAVGDPGYQAWAKEQNGIGDQEFWNQAHQIGYEWLRDVLPIRV